MKSRTETPYSQQLTPYLISLQEKQDKLLKMLVKKNNKLEFKQIKIEQTKYKKPTFQQMRIKNNYFFENESSQESKFRKYKNFYYRSKNYDKPEPHLELRVQEILDRICNVKKKQLSDLRPESNLMKRKGYSVDLQKSQHSQNSHILQQRQKSFQQNSFNYFLQPAQLNSDSDWLEFVFG